MDIKVLSSIKENFVTKLVDNELIIVPLQDDVASMEQLFHLNEVGQFIWENLSENESIESLTKKISDEFDVEVAVARNDLKTFLSELEQKLSQ